MLSIPVYICPPLIFVNRVPRRSSAIFKTKSRKRGTGNKIKKNKYGRQEKGKKTSPFARVLGDVEPLNMASRTSRAQEKWQYILDYGSIRDRCYQLLKALTRYRELDNLHRMRNNHLKADFKCKFMETKL